MGRNFQGGYVLLAEAWSARSVSFAWNSRCLPNRFFFRRKEIELSPGLCAIPQVEDVGVELPRSGREEGALLRREFSILCRTQESCLEVVDCNLR